MAKKPGRTVGLTDDPEQRKEEHGNPQGFRVLHRFRSERAAREWEQEMLGRGYDGGVGGEGWKHGYTFKTPRRRK